MLIDACSAIVCAFIYCAVFIICSEYRTDMRLHTCGTFCICQLQYCCCQRSSSVRFSSTCSTAHDSSGLFAADIVMLPWSHLLHQVCVSLVQPLTLMHQQPCAVVSLVSTSLMWSDGTASQLRPLQLAAPRCIFFSCCSAMHLLQLLLPDCICFNLLLPDCVRFSCCSPTV